MLSNSPKSDGQNGAPEDVINPEIDAILGAVLGLPPGSVEGKIPHGFNEGDSGSGEVVTDDDMDAFFKQAMMPQGEDYSLQGPNPHGELEDVRIRELLNVIPEVIRPVFIAAMTEVQSYDDALVIFRATAEAFVEKTLDFAIVETGCSGVDRLTKLRIKNAKEMITSLCAVRIDLTALVHNRFLSLARTGQFRCMKHLYDAFSDDEYGLLVLLRKIMEAFAQKKKFAPAGKLMAAFPDHEKPLSTLFGRLIFSNNRFRIADFLLREHANVFGGKFQPPASIIAARSSILAAQADQLSSRLMPE